MSTVLDAIGLTPGRRLRLHWRVPSSRFHWRRWERTAEAGETVVGEGGPTQAVVGDILGQQVHRHIPAAGTMAELWLRGSRSPVQITTRRSASCTPSVSKPNSRRSISCCFKEMISYVSRYIVYVTASLTFETRSVQSCVVCLSCVLHFNYDKTININKFVVMWFITIP